MSTFALRLAFAMLLVTTVPLAAYGAPDDTTPEAGSLVARAPDGTPLGGCPLTHTDVAVDAAGFVARVTVTQTFENRFTEPVEAVYTFPLSARAAVDSMVLRTGDRTIRGDIKVREEARRLYDAARASGRLAAVLDQERPNVFTQSVANLVPGAKVEVQLAYVETLVFGDGAFELTVPTVVGPRFVPGTPTGHAGTGWAPDTTRVPDASRITPPVTPPDTRAGHDVAIAVDLDAGVPIVDLVAPLHAIDVERPDPTRARVRLQSRAEIPNRDFVLRWAVATDELRSGVLAHRDGDEDGTASVVLLPTRTVTPATAAPKELVFLIDRSGSQSGKPLAKAKETMLWILDHMHPHDTFQVVDFGSEAHVLFARPELASPAMKAQARAYVTALEADGGTMMAEAVRTVCAMPADAHRLRIVTFMTDGFIGNDFEVLELVRSLRGTSRWFAFGTGNSVNRFLLDGIAREGGGEADVVLLDDPGAKVAERFWQRISSPVLTDVRVRFEGLDVMDVEPAVLADVWAERPVVVHARYRTPGRGKVVVSGWQQGAPYRQELDVTLPARAPGNTALPSIWARARVDALMAEDLQAFQTGNYGEELKERIVEIALAHHLMTQLTSFVAVEERLVNDGGRQQTVVVPVEMPDGVSREGVFGDEARILRQAPATANLPRGSSDAASASGAMLALGGFAGTTAPSPPPHEERDVATRAARRDADPSVRARTRLAPELLALLERGTDPSVTVVDGRVRVAVVLRGDERAARTELRRAGFRLERLGAGVAVGEIPIARLAALAELACVETVRVAPLKTAGGAVPRAGWLAQLWNGASSSETPKTSLKSR